MRCHICNYENPADARFCAGCGNRLPERRVSASERRVVTVLFCDVKGSTSLAEKLDPEDWTEVIDGAFRVLTGPIERYGGTVARLLGDAVLAFFGAPAAHEDDPERAIRAGLEMLSATGSYRDLLVRERGDAFAQFDIRIGINTGLAVIGDVGAGRAVEYTGMGDAVNVAARLQSLARPGTMLVSGRTLKAAPPVFDSEPAGQLELAGRTEKLDAHVVRGLAAPRSAPAGPAASPLVGRDREMAALRDALTEVRRGGGRIVSIIGDAGLGKTRLIDEFQREWEREPVPGQRWSEARGQSYEQGRPYGLIRQHLLALSGTTEADPPEVMRSRVAELLPAERRADPQALQTVDTFLAVDPERAATGPEGQELRADLHRLLHEIGRGLAAKQAVFVFDDLQWSDPASADVLIESLALVEEAPVIFICSFRPDRQAPSWKVKQKLETDFPHRYEELVLEPLSPADSSRLLATLIPDGGVPDDLSDRILDKAEGNPLFLEEIVRALMDDGTLERDGAAWLVTREVAEIALPTSLQAVLAARIDRLDAAARETLQAASVIGRTFLYRILATIREATATLDRELRDLQRLELVREQAREPEREYVFRHALTQEAAYGSILQRRRRELHVRVGESLERLFPDRMEELAGVIGHHYAEAQDARAVRLLRLAGERALRLFAVDDAVLHYRRLVSLLRPAEEDADTLCAVYTKYGRALELRGDYAEALDLYRQLERLAQERADQAMEGEALAAQMVVHANPTPFLDPSRVEELATRTIDLARARGDKPLLAKLLWNVAQKGFWRADPDGGIAAALESAQIAREIGATEQLGFSLNTLAQIYRENAQVDEAEKALRESIELFRAVGNRPMEADSFSTLGFVHLYRAEYDKALEACMAAYKISDALDNDWGRSYALFSVAFVRYEQGDWGDAIRTYEECISWGVKAGFYAAQTAMASDLGLLYAVAGDPERGVKRIEAIAALAAEKFKDWATWPLAQLARVSVVAGDLTRAAAVIAEASPHARTRGDLYINVYLGLARAELALAEGRYADAARVGLDERGLATDRGLRPFEKDFDLMAGLGLLGTGDLDGARTSLQRALETSRATGSRRLLPAIYGALAQVADRQGMARDAAAFRAEQASAIDGIARSLAEVGLEAAYRDRARRAAEPLAQRT